MGAGHQAKDFLWDRETTDFHEVVPFSNINFSRNRACIRETYYIEQNYLNKRVSEACPRLKQMDLSLQFANSSLELYFGVTLQSLALRTVFKERKCLKQKFSIQPAPGLTPGRAPEAGKEPFSLPQSL